MVLSRACNSVNRVVIKTYFFSFKMTFHSHLMGNKLISIMSNVFYTNVCLVRLTDYVKYRGLFEFTIFMLRSFIYQLAKCEETSRQGAECSRLLSFALLDQTPVQISYKAKFQFRGKKEKRISSRILNISVTCLTGRNMATSPLWKGLWADN